MTDRPWCDEERAWALECALSGDSVEEIAEIAGRDVEDVAGVLGRAGRLSPRTREILSFYSAGCTFPEIGRELDRSWRAMGARVSDLRRAGFAIPHRRYAIVEGRAASA
ncbi:MAG: hypothetical protein AB1760_10195 [Pseudomonadota bacterium]